jgi:hypothetical protein
MDESLELITTLGNACDPWTKKTGVQVMANSI